MRSGRRPTAADCAEVEDLANDISLACRRASPENFQRIRPSVSNVYLVLKDIKDSLIRDSTGLSPTGAETLNEQLCEARAALDDLKRLLQGYNRLTTTTQQRYDFIRFDLEEVSEIDTKLTCITTSLQGLANKLELNCHSNIQKFINKYVNEVARGLHEGSILGSSPSKEKRNSWEKFREELLRQGLSPAVLSEQSDFIQAIFRRVLERGLPDGTTDWDIPTGSDADSENSQISTLVDGKYYETLDNRKHKGGRGESKKHSRLVILALKFLRIVSDERLIEAADENDIGRVRELIRRGANVNASDKWLWTALHMAAYGGYPDIAKVLIKAGAGLDPMTVDGETPLYLAEKNGHLSVYEVIKDEKERSQNVFGEEEGSPADDGNA